MNPRNSAVRLRQKPTGHQAYRPNCKTHVSLVNASSQYPQPKNAASGEMTSTVRGPVVVGTGQTSTILTGVSPLILPVSLQAATFSLTGNRFSPPFYHLGERHPLGTTEPLCSLVFKTPDCPERSHHKPKSLGRQSIGKVEFTKPRCLKATTDQQNQFMRLPRWLASNF